MTQKSGIENNKDLEKDNFYQGPNTPRYTWWNMALGADNKDLPVLIVSKAFEITISKHREDSLGISVTVYGKNGTEGLFHLYQWWGRDGVNQIKEVCHCFVCACRCALMNMHSMY